MPLKFLKFQWLKWDLTGNALAGQALILYDIQPYFIYRLHSLEDFTLFKWCLQFVNCYVACWSNENFTKLDILTAHKWQYSVDLLCKSTDWFLYDGNISR